MARHVKELNDLLPPDIERYNYLFKTALKAGSLATAVWKAFTAAMLSPWVFLVLLTSFLIAAVKAVFSFMANKTRYMQSLTANLYFQNLANNASALAHLIDAAEAEECKELLLAYFTLYVQRRREFLPHERSHRL